MISRLLLVILLCLIVVFAGLATAHGQTPTPTPIPTPTKLDEDLLDAEGCGFNATPGTYFNASAVVDADYTVAGTSPFETPAAAGISAPQGVECLGRVQWSIDGQDERQPLYVAADAMPPRQQFYFEYDFHYPTGFPFCLGKVFRAGRQENAVFVGDWIEIAGGLTDDTTTAAPNLFFGTHTTEDSPDQVTRGDYAAFGARDTWFRVGVHARWNSHTEGSPNADGFLRFYLDDSEVAGVAQTGKVWSVDPGDAPGFTNITAPLNMSYAACDGTEVDSAVWVANFRLYDVPPFAPTPTPTPPPTPTITPTPTPTPTPVPALAFGFNFRSTEGCGGEADDGPNQHWVGTSHQYPRTYTIGELEIDAGYESGVNILAQDWCGNVSVGELGGSHAHNPATTTQTRFRVDLLEPGAYEICAAFGDRFFYTGEGEDLIVAILDGDAEIYSVEVSPNTRTANHWYDIDGSVHTQAEWKDGQTCKTLSFATTTLRLDLCDGTARECQPVSHLSVKAVPTQASGRPALRYPAGRGTRFDRFNR